MTEIEKAAILWHEKRGSLLIYGAGHWREGRDSAYKNPTFRRLEQESADAENHLHQAIDPLWTFPR